MSKTTATKQNTTLYVIALSVLGVLILFLGSMLILTSREAAAHATALEANYQKSYYNLVENINSAETELSKALTTNDDTYTGELLLKISKNANNAQNNLGLLPISTNGVEESARFINQLGGYCETLSKKIAQDGQITASEKQTLQELYNSLVDMKNSLNQVSAGMTDQYSILQNSLNIKDDYNDFTLQLQSIKTNDVEYPTMIYDGPFSDSQIRKDIKGLQNASTTLTEEQAREVVQQLFDVEEVTFMGETTSLFETYDFTFRTKRDSENYVQITKLDGHLITLAGYSDDLEPEYTLPEVIEQAKAFIAKNGINNMECVWFDVIGSNAYLNFAPVENSIIIYPDLIKVKCSLVNMEITGYEARSYFTNSTTRTIPAFAITSQQAQAKIKSGYEIIAIRKALAPIDFQEILCYEFECNFNDSTYYIYVNGVTGSVANILKVINTTDGSKIM